MAMLYNSYWLICVLTVSFLGCENSTRDVPAAKSSSEYALQTNSQNISGPNITGTPNSQVDLRHLRKWAGKYPINTDDTKFSNFFETAEVKAILMPILKEQGFKDLLLHFSGTDLIKERDGFLVMLGTSDRKQDLSYSLVALNPDTGETHVFFLDKWQRLKGFSNTNGDGNLTPLIKQEILVHAKSSEPAIIGNLKNRPAEGFFCYAIHPKDSDVKAENRQYLFVNTDKGGIFNIEGVDIELNEKSSEEIKGDKGRTYAHWTFANLKIVAKFDLAIEKTGNERSDTFYEGTLTVTTMTKTQTIQIKAFCGG